MIRNEKAGLPIIGAVLPKGAVIDNLANADLESSVEYSEDGTDGPESLSQPSQAFSFRLVCHICSALAQQQELLKCGR